MKTYLLISPQPWGKMYLSKHNYAMELAEEGNTVYFLNPPTYTKFSVSLELNVKREQGNLYVVDYLLSLPVHILRFKARALHDFLISNTLIKSLNKLADFDEIWCFEPNIFSSFRKFNAKSKLLFIVDYFDNNALKRLAKEADGIVSISSHILDYFSFVNRPKLLLHHGLNKNFSLLAQKRLKQEILYTAPTSVKVAYVGNLLQGERVDYATLQRIIEQNPGVEFHIYGPHGEKGNTLGTTMNNNLQTFLAFLNKSSNVHLHGIKEQAALAREVQEMDVLLTCYNYLTDHNKSSNCHKVVEYLSTGKVVVANRLLAYENLAGLVEMPAEMTNENLPLLFKKVVANLAFYNSTEKQKARIRFALENTYAEHIKTITQFLQSTISFAKKEMV